MVLGPSIGGLIVSFASWRWIFLVVVPFGLAGLATNYLLRNTDTVEPGAVQTQQNALSGMRWA